MVIKINNGIKHDILILKKGREVVVEDKLKEILRSFESFTEGSNYESYKFMGAHPSVENNVGGYLFNLWAPKAKEVRVVGDFNNWTGHDHKMKLLHEKGLWSLFIPALRPGEIYKYEVVDSENKIHLKADPYGFFSEKRPNTASILTEKSTYRWGDGRWIGKRRKSNIYESPLNIYEVHLGSFIRKKEDFASYEEITEALITHVKNMGYTHIEVMPLTEHPLDDSWGYQVTGYFSPTSRYGTPWELKKFIDKCHRANLGVILDWVPGHFCKDSHGLFNFDGTHLYEYNHPLKYENPGWGTANFDLGKPEVKSFLYSSALYFIKEFHIDGLRVDAVSNMIYLDFCRPKGQWLPNERGTSINFEAVEFLQQFNKIVHSLKEGIITIAEESTKYSAVTSLKKFPSLGFDFKWNMGWMNDTLKYMALREEDKYYNHNLMNFSLMYNYDEGFILALSHDEVVYGKKSLLNKMPGDTWKRFAALRCYLTFMYCHPGKKTLFMGDEFGQFDEWDFRKPLDLFLAKDFETHRATLEFTRELNSFYLKEPALWTFDYKRKGFKWLDPDNKKQSVLIFMRHAYEDNNTLIVISNFKAETHYSFKVGIPAFKAYKQVFNTDEKRFGGAGEVMEEVLFPKEGKVHGQNQYIEIKVPPLGTVILKES